MNPSLSGGEHKTPLWPLWEHAQTFNFELFVSATILFPTKIIAVTILN